MPEVSAERWEKVREVFGGALELETGEWDAYLESTCVDDPELEAEVQSLLAAHRAGGDFLELAAAATETPAALPADSMVGQHLGAYRLERCIGRGGMGAVYSAVRADAAFDKRVAIKVLRPGLDSAEVTRRFRAERQILAALEHPSIARLIDGGAGSDGSPYLVMEQIEGLAIDDYCDRHGLRVAERLKLFLEVCAAVQYAHRNLVVHRDLKPSNILVTESGEPKLLDFGIAKILDPEPSSAASPPTETLMRLMTPTYASPEQILGQPVTTASDVYALGVLLYLLLTGRHPHGLENRSPADLLWAIQYQEPEPPSSAVARAQKPSDRGRQADGGPTTESIAAVRGADPGRLRRRLAGDLDNIVLMALRKEPERRYASVDQLSEDLRRHLDGRPVMARGDSFGYRSGKFMRRHRFAVAAAALFFTAVLGFGIVMAFQRQAIAHQRDRLAEERQQTETERLRGEQVTSFLVDLFETSDPFSSPDDARKVSARQLLDRGSERLADLDGQPEIRAALAYTVGGIYRRLGLLDEATPLLESALETRRRQLGSEHPKVAESLDELGVLRQERGDYLDAHRLLSEALAIRQTLFGENHRATADSLNHLAGLALARGDFADAERQQQRALAIYRQQFGPESIEVANGLSWLASILQSQGDHSAAERAYTETLAIESRLLGEEHLNVATIRANLAQLYLRRGEAGRAELSYRQALETFRRRLGDDHVQVVYCIEGLAAAVAARGDFRAAEELYGEALDLLHRLRGPAHPDLAVALDGLADVRLASGDHRGAQDAYAAALDIRRQAHGEGNPYLVLSLTGLAQAAIAGGDYDGAERRINEALAIGLQAFPRGHWRIDVARSLLGECRLKTGRYGEAEPLLAESYEALKQRMGGGAATTLNTLDLLIELYDAWGRPEAAASLRAERVAAAQESPGT